MGKLVGGEVIRTLVATALFVGALVPVTSVTAAQPAPPQQHAAALPTEARTLSLRPSEDVLDPLRPAPSRVTFAGARLSLVPPAGWQPAPETSLNPLSSPASPVFELARYQLRIGEGTLYAQPIPITSGLVNDAGAILSVGIAREGGELVGLDVDPHSGELGVRGGFYVLEDSAVYEGLASLTQYFVARETDRVIVLHAVADTDRWPLVEAQVRAAMASLRAQQDGPHGPAAPPAPAAEPEPAAEAAAEPPHDPTAAARARILARAASLLGLPYVWGGNSPAYGMDCSAYVSWAWGVSRYTTDSIWAVSHHITKDQLRPGDAMNLTIGSDPQRRGHIRIFEAWANDARTLVWVYEQTPPRAVHRVIAYDPRYQPVRLNGLSGIGDAPLIVAPPSAVQPVYFAPPAPRAAPRATPRPTVQRTPRPTVQRTPRPTATPRPTPTVRPATTATPRPIATARPTPVPTVRTSTARPEKTARPARTR